MFRKTAFLIGSSLIGTAISATLTAAILAPIPAIDDRSRPLGERAALACETMERTGKPYRLDVDGLEDATGIGSRIAALCPNVETS